MSKINSNVNDALHALLESGILCVEVTECDIRRDFSGAPAPAHEDEARSTTSSGGSGRGGGRKTVLGSALSSMTPIETDYILQVKSADAIMIDNEHQTILPASSLQVQTLEMYYCSKRYVDIRNLAHTVRRHAEGLVQYYAGTKSPGPKNGTILKGLEKGLERVLRGPVEVAQLITNSEPTSSDLTSHLDSVFQGPKSKNGKGSQQLERRTSELLNEGAPHFVREIMVGVDGFYQEIFSEKRQFNHKSKFGHVKSVAERRKVIINRAFSILIDALSSADIASITKHQPEAIPKHMLKIIEDLKRFLLTDVIVENGKEESSFEEDKGAPQSQVTAGMGGSAVLPKSTRRRGSILERLDEEQICKDSADLLIRNSAFEGEHPHSENEEKHMQKGDEGNDHGTDNAENLTAAGDVRNESGVISPTVLPDHPVDFAIMTTSGAVLFKLLESREANLQMDLLLMIVIACGLVGYQLGASSVAHLKHIKKTTKDPSPLLEQPSPTKMDEIEATPRRGLDRRDTLNKSAGSHNLERNPLILIQASMRNVIGGLGGKLDDGKEEKLVTKAKTFEKFPDGAPIGSHLNCWSSPPSSNFRVRGPNYLKNKKKVPSGDYLFPCRGCDLFLTDNPPANIGQNRSILEGELRDVSTFIINYRLPWGVFISYHEIPERFLPFLRRGQGYGELSAPLPSLSDMPAGERTLCNFLLSDSEDKNQVWKIVPVVVEGPWVVKRVVGGKPAIVGTKMPISYVYQPPEKGLAEYLEADLDIVSSAAARNILAVVRSYTQVLTIDLGYVVQGNKEEELPEQMMLGLRLHGLDPLTAGLLPESDVMVTLPELEDDNGNDTD